MIQQYTQKRTINILSCIFILKSDEFCDIINLQQITRGAEMAISYKKLWKLLIDKNMKKKDLREAAHLSPSLIAKLGRNENVTTDVLVRICEALECDISDIAEITVTLNNYIKNLLNF